MAVKNSKSKYFKRLSYNADNVNFDPREYVTTSATERDIIIWKEIFDSFDSDGDGRLTPRDLLEAMGKHNGYHPKRNYIYQTMAPYDKDESGNIDFREFIRMVYQRPYLKDTTEDMQRVFNDIDLDGKGYISRADLLLLAADLKEELKESEIDAIMKKIGMSGEDKINFAAFTKFNQLKREA